MQALFGGGEEDILTLLMMRNGILNYYLIIFGCLCWCMNGYQKNKINILFLQ